MNTCSLEGRNRLIRPLDHLRSVGKLYPNAWKEAERFLSRRGNDLPQWPSWCFLPLAAWYAIVSEGRARIPVEKIDDIGRLAALGAWRYSQGIYRFASELQQSLVTTEIGGDLPADVLLRLPEWSIYIETPGISCAGLPLHGFWAHLEWDANTERRELRLLLDTDPALIPFPIALGEWSLSEAVTRTIDEAARQTALDMNGALQRPAAIDHKLAREFQPLISLLLYLCSDEPEIDADRRPGLAPQRPSPRKVKGGLRWFPPDSPRVWTVGRATAEHLRRDAGTCTSGGSHSTRPHLRRAHWHGFWTGPRGGERLFKYHWLPPILVSGSSEDFLAALPIDP